MSKNTFQPAWWCRGPHAQTMWAKFFRARTELPLRKERLETPDGDFLDLVHHEHAERRRDRPRLLLLHGLEGTIRSHYVTGIFEQAHRRGWDATLLVFRGCGEELNRARRFYHSGETTDPAFVVDRLIAAAPDSPLVLVGVSLGGNVMLKWLGESGDRIPEQIRAAAAISVPFDLERGCLHLQHGFARVYDRHFLKTLRRKAIEKLRRFPDLFDRAALERARTIYDFDDTVTAPVHGFRDAHDYYSRSSSLGYLAGIRRPTLLLSAFDDPFLPPIVLSEVAAVVRGNACVELELQARGGHVGFIGGRVPWKPYYYAEHRAADYLASALARSVR